MTFKATGPTRLSEKAWEAETLLLKVMEKVSHALSSSAEAVIRLEPEGDPFCDLRGPLREAQCNCVYIYIYTHTLGLEDSIL